MTNKHIGYTKANGKRFFNPAPSLYRQKDPLVGDVWSDGTVVSCFGSAEEMKDWVDAGKHQVKPSSILDWL